MFRSRMTGCYYYIHVKQSLENLKFGFHHFFNNTIRNPSYTAMTVDQSTFRPGLTSVLMYCICAFF